MEDCRIKYGVISRPHWISDNFGSNFDSASNIVFVNGDLDPWIAGGVTSSKSKTVDTIIIEGGAHHLDLRFAQEDDIPAVVRNIKLNSIYLFIDVYIIYFFKYFVNVNWCTERGSYTNEKADFFLAKNL